MRRVVVTGLGAVTPLASGVEHSWKRLIEGQSGITNITKFDASESPCQIAGEVPLGEGEGDLNINAIIPKKEQRKMSSFITYGVVAATEAIEDSGWKPENEESLKRTGVLMGSGVGGLANIEEATLVHNSGKKLSPFFLPSVLINLISGHISMKYGFRGPNHAVVTACSTGTHAIGDAARLISFGDADVMIAGSAEDAICPVGIAGFCASRALSTGYNDNPQAASRPWDEGRDGFVMGEGSGVLVLEEYEHAKARGAKIYGEVVGYGLSGDAHHITAPHSEGRGAYDAMAAAVGNAKISVDEIDYVNAHGTSTPLGDTIEFGGVKRLLGAHAGNIAMSSTKSAIGHLLGGAGSVEAIFSLLAMRDGVVPPTLNLNNPSEGVEGINLVPHTAQDKKVGVALSNSFGFGGTNATVIFKKV